MEELIKVLMTFASVVFVLLVLYGIYLDWPRREQEEEATAPAKCAACGSYQVCTRYDCPLA